MKKRRIFPIIVLLLFALIFISVVRFAYPSTIIDPYKGEAIEGDLSGMPLHIDEWQHIAQGQHIAERGIGENPYTLEAHQEREWGFHLFLALFSLMGFSLVALYPYFAILCFVVNTFLVYYIAKEWTHNEWKALVAGFLFILLPANTNLMGNWFFIPFTFSLMLFLFCIFIFLDVAVNVRQKKLFVKRNILFVFCALLLFFVYPVAAAMLFLIVMMYFLLERKSILNNKLLFGILSGGVVLFVVFLLFYLLGTSWSLQELSGTLLFFSHWVDMPYHNLFFIVFGIPSTILFVFGCINLFRERKYFYAKFLFGILLIFIIESLLYYLFHFSILIPYARLLYYFMIFATIISAFCVQNVFHLRKKLYRFYLFIILILLVCSAWGPFSVFPERFSLHQIADDNDLQLFEYLGTQEYGNVLANPFLSNAITPLTSYPVVAMIPANLPSSQSPYGAFVLAGCKSKKALAERYNVRYVLSEQYFSCDQFHQKLATKDRILYEYSQE